LGPQRFVQRVREGLGPKLMRHWSFLFGSFVFSSKLDQMISYCSLRARAWALLIGVISFVRKSSRRHMWSSHVVAPFFCSGEYFKPQESSQGLCAFPTPPTSTSTPLIAYLSENVLSDQNRIPLASPYHQFFDIAAEKSASPDDAKTWPAVGQHSRTYRRVGFDAFNA
jgi:hypothetical protein